MPKFKFPSLDTLFGSGGGANEPPELVIVGLGNPGEKFARTRHNVGFWCIDRLMKEYSISLERKNRSALVGQGFIDGHSVALAKPRTYVNLSGEAINYLKARFQAAPKDILIVYDDIALPLGKLRLRARGSAGGHNGIKSVIEALGTQEFPRLRVGIGRPPEGADQIGYVIGAMSPDEEKTIDDAIENVVKAIACILTDGIDEAMGRFN